MSFKCMIGWHDYCNVYPNNIHNYLKCNNCGFKKVILGKSYEDIPEGWMDEAKVARGNGISGFGNGFKTFYPPVRPRPDYAFLLNHKKEGDVNE